MVVGVWTYTTDFTPIQPLVLNMLITGTQNKHRWTEVIRKWWCSWKKCLKKMVYLVYTIFCWWSLIQLGCICRLNLCLAEHKHYSDSDDTRYKNRTKCNFSGLWALERFIEQVNLLFSHMLQGHYTRVNGLASVWSTQPSPCHVLKADSQLLTLQGKAANICLKIYWLVTRLLLKK